MDHASRWPRSWAYDLTTMKDRQFFINQDMCFSGFNQLVISVSSESLIGLSNNLWLLQQFRHTRVILIWDMVLAYDRLVKVDYKLSLKRFNRPGSASYPELKLSLSILVHQPKPYYVVELPHFSRFKIMALVYDCSIGTHTTHTGD